MLRPARMAEDRLAVLAGPPLQLAYLRRLAAGGRHGGTVVTSMRQLVAGLAALHPAWTLTGEGFEDRDRHHQAVRRRLRDLQAMDLVRWRVGVDENGQERRTELELREVPELSHWSQQASTRQAQFREARRAWEVQHPGAVQRHHTAEERYKLSQQRHQTAEQAYEMAVARELLIASQPALQSRPPASPAAQPRPPALREGPLRRHGREPPGPTLGR